jgi:hypothetical protein
MLCFYLSELQCGTVSNTQLWFCLESSLSVTLDCTRGNEYARDTVSMHAGKWIYKRRSAQGSIYIKREGESLVSSIVSGTPRNGNRIGIRQPRCSTVVGCHKGRPLTYAFEPTVKLIHQFDQKHKVLRVRWQKRLALFLREYVRV